MIAITSHSFDLIDSDSFCNLSCDGPEVSVRRQHCPQPPQGVRAHPVALPASWWGLGAHSVTLYWHTIIIVPVKIFNINVISRTMTLTVWKPCPIITLNGYYYILPTSIRDDSINTKAHSTSAVYKTVVWIYSNYWLLSPQVCTGTATKYSTYREYFGL